VGESWRVERRVQYIENFLGRSCGAGFFASNGSKDLEVLG
jgi:hypothetical protein